MRESTLGRSATLDRSHLDESLSKNWATYDKSIKSNANLGRGKTLVYGLVCVWEVMVVIPAGEVSDFGEVT